jgi:hypothetical protein
VLREIQEAADRVSEQLTRKGQPGQFYAFEVGVIVRVRWNGARRDEADAEKMLIRFLEFVGYDARQSLGLGVTVDARIPRALDHEACVHNQEPRPETLAECEAFG